MNNEAQRAAFEAWASEKELDTLRYGLDNHFHPGEYAQFVELAWLAWQAAIEHAKKTMCNRN